MRAEEMEEPGVQVALERRVDQARLAFTVMKATTGIYLLT